MRNIVRLAFKLKRRVFSYFYTLVVKLSVEKVGANLKVNGYSIVTQKTVLGSNVNFNGMRISGSGRITIGDNFHSGSNCKILTSIHNYDKGRKIPYDETIISKDVTIEDNVWLGIDVIVLPGVHISEGAIIQAGSVVCSNIPPCAIAGGHPASVFKYRDKLHYNRLKNEKLFF